MLPAKELKNETLRSAFGRLIKGKQYEFFDTPDSIKIPQIN